MWSVFTRRFTGSRRLMENYRQNFTIASVLQKKFTSIRISVAYNLGFGILMRLHKESRC
jgi:hypothetical protein